MSGETEPRGGGEDTMSGRAGAAEVHPPLADPKGATDPHFIDDLVAANRLKGFLLGRGTALDSRTLVGLNDLLTAFAEDVAQHEKAWGLNRPPPAQARGGGWWRRGEA